MVTKITVDDIRRAGFCVPGLREVALTHNLDLRKIVRGEYRVEDVAHLDDANIKRVIEVAEERATGGEQ